MRIILIIIFAVISTMALAGWGSPAHAPTIDQRIDALESSVLILQNQVNELRNKCIDKC